MANFRASFFIVENFGHSKISIYFNPHKLFFKKLEAHRKLASRIIYKNL
jgi:hypothetical protein